MSDYQEHQTSSENIPNKLQICLFSTQQQICDFLGQLLDGDRYELKCHHQREDLANFVVNNYEQIDCLVLEINNQLNPLLNQLWQEDILLPTVILEAEHLIGFEGEEGNQLVTSITDMEIKNIYHEAEVRLYPTQLKEIKPYINLAISKFISLAANVKIDNCSDKSSSQSSDQSSDQKEQHKTGMQKSLIAQQRRLTEKLTERLGYLGFFYKRNPDFFWLNLSQEQKNRLVHKISQSYRQILLVYFDHDPEINKLIDDLVDRAFFANISTSQILEIHMDLMDDFAHQLKLEGRNDDILLDYRLPLIDIISHLCEMYRRSIPEPDASVNLLFTVE